MTQEVGQVRAQEGGCGQWFQMHLGKQEDVSKAIGMCLGGMGAGKGDTPALRGVDTEEVEEDAPGRVGWEQAVKGPECPLHLLSWLPSLGIRISSVAFWLLQPSLHYFT